MKRVSLPSLCIETVEVPLSWEIVHQESTMDMGLARLVPIEIGQEESAQHQLLLLATTAGELDLGKGTPTITVREEATHKVHVAQSCGRQRHVVAELWVSRANELPNDTIEAVLHSIVHTEDGGSISVKLLSKHCMTTMSLPAQFAGSTLLIGSRKNGSECSAENQHLDTTLVGAISELGIVEFLVESVNGFVASVAVPTGCPLHSVGSVRKYLPFIQKRLNSLKRSRVVSFSQISPLDQATVGGLANVELQAENGASLWLVVLQPSLGSQYMQVVIGHAQGTPMIVAETIRPIEKSGNAALLLCDPERHRVVRLPLKALPEVFRVSRRRDIGRLTTGSSFEIKGTTASGVHQTVVLQVAEDGRSAKEFTEFIESELLATDGSLPGHSVAASVKVQPNNVVLFTAMIDGCEEERQYRVHEVKNEPGALLVVSHPRKDVPLWLEPAVKSFATTCE